MPRLAAVPLPALLKTARLGYDGKGQARIASREELAATFASWKGAPCVLEQLLALEREISVVLARSEDGAVAVFPVAENRHARGILDVTIAPRAHRCRARRRGDGDRGASRGKPRLRGRPRRRDVRRGRQAPAERDRPAPAQQRPLHHRRVPQLAVRAAGARALRPAAGRSLAAHPRGDGEPAGRHLVSRRARWEAVLSPPRRAPAPLYGKREARPGRKMGQVTVCEASPSARSPAALAIRASHRHRARRRESV
jgi:5-(carboxyamino)imidazole ribonucleotide synthase